MSRQLSRRSTVVVLLLLLAVATLLRFYALDGQSFWADEGNSVVLAARTPGEIMSAAAADIHPPAYYLLLSAWGKVFGLDESGARSLSVLFGILLVWVIYLLGSRLRNTSTGLIAATLAAVNPFLIYYSQEARMYELLALCAALSAYGLLLWITPPRRRVLGGALYVLAALLGLYTHYAFPIHPLALNVVWVIWVWRGARGQRSEVEDQRSEIRDQKSEVRGQRSEVGKGSGGEQRWGGRGQEVGTWVVLNLIIALLYLPWAPVAFRQLMTWPAPPVQLGLPEALEQTGKLFLCGPSGCAGTPALLAVATILSLFLAVIAILPRWRTRGSWLESALPLIWLLAPLAAMLLFDIFSPVFFKFLIIAVPAYVLLIAVGINRVASLEFGAGASDFRPLISAALVILLILPALPTLDRYFHDPAVARDDYRAIAAYIKAIAGPADAVILDAPGQIDAFSQYDHGEAAVYALPTSRPLDPDQTIAALDQIIAGSNRIYAIYWATEQADPEGLIERYLAEHAFKAWDSWVGNLRFVAYSAAPPPEPVPYPTPPRFGQHITLEALGFDPGASTRPGDIVSVRLQWSTDEALDARYKVSLQILDAGNQVIAQVDSEPVGGIRPTTSWQPREIIDDAYGLPIPLGTPPGDYPLMLVMYDAGSGGRLPIRTPDGISDMLNIAIVGVTLPDQAPPPAILPIRYHASEQIGDIIFLGHDRYKLGYGHAPDTPLAPGDPLHLTTFWQATAPLASDYSFELRLDGAPLGRFQLAGPGYPTSRWKPDFPWRGEHTIMLPPELATGGTHTLTLQIIDEDGQPTGDPIVLSPELRY